jgi:hypothetical protein
MVLARESVFRLFIYSLKLHSTIHAVLLSEVSEYFVMSSWYMKIGYANKWLETLI